MKKIKLTKGYTALADDEDYEWLNQYSWHASSRAPYAAMRKSKYGKVHLMHRMIMEKVHGDISGYYVDHINHNSVDNRRENLRLCTMAENLRNSRKLDRSTSSRYKGVCYMISSKRKKRWIAYIEIEKGKRKYLGYFHTETEAALAYNQAASEYFGEFANLNDI